MSQYVGYILLPFVLSFVTHESQTLMGGTVLHDGVAKDRVEYRLLKDEWKSECQEVSLMNSSKVISTWGNGKEMII